MFPLFDFLYPGYNAAERPTGEPLWVMLLSLRLPVLARSAGSPTAILLARQGCGKDLIPTGNALRASAAHSSGRISSKDLIPTGNALRASAAHSSGRISSKDLIPTGNALCTHPVGSVVQKRHRFSPVLLLILQISSPLLVTPLLFMKQSLSDLYVNMPLLR